MLTTLYTLLYRLSRLSVWVCGTGFLLSACFVFVEVVLRNVTTSYIGSDEIAGYVFAVAVAWGFSFCLYERAHVRIDVAYQSLARRLRAWLDLLSLVALLLFSSLIALRAWRTYQESWDFQAVSITPLQTPMWIPQLVWAVGLVFFAFNCAFLAIYVLTLLLRGQTVRANAVAGIPLLQGEAPDAAENQRNA